MDNYRWQKDAVLAILSIQVVSSVFAGVHCQVLSSTLKGTHTQNPLCMQIYPKGVYELIHFIVNKSISFGIVLAV